MQAQADLTADTSFTTHGNARQASTHVVLGLGSPGCCVGRPRRAYLVIGTCNSVTLGPVAVISRYSSRL